MTILALTGGIGSGKSFVARMLAVIGCPVYDTDSETKRLYSTSMELRSALRTILGCSIFTPDGRIDRSVMASMVFSDPKLLAQVEAAVYPVLASHLSGWLDNLQACGTKVAVVESALILEKELFRRMADRVLTVSAPEEIRVQRAIERDGTDRSEVIDRMKCQNSDIWREDRADFVIINDGRPLLPQLMNIFENLSPGGCGGAYVDESSEK